MGSPAWLIDTDIFIDHFEDRAAATAFLKDHQSECAVSVVTRAELAARESEIIRAVRARFLERFPLFGIDGEVADTAGGFRRTHRLKLPDAFQAAIARCRGMTLVTRNTKDFPVSKFPFVLVPYEVTGRSG